MRISNRAINSPCWAWCAAGLMALALSAPSALLAQDRDRGRGDNGGGGRREDTRGGGDGRADRGRSRGDDRSVGRSDDRRDGGSVGRSDDHRDGGSVGRSDDRRDGGSVGRSDDRGSGGSVGRSDDRASTRSVFTRSEEGRRFDNGAVLRAATRYTDRHWDTFFPSHYYSYPHYRGTRFSIDVVFSPFYSYYGVCPPYVDRACVIFGRPSLIYIDVPIYVGGACRGYRYDDDGDSYYLSRSADTRWQDDREVKQAVYDLEDAFRQADITLLARLTDPHTKVAIFSKGQYQYSVEPNDYLDMTRDFMRASDTTAFDVYRVHYRTADVYQLFAKHTYKNKDGKSRMVYLCMVMERISGQWTLTQVDTSPDRMQ